MVLAEYKNLDPRKGTRSHHSTSFSARYLSEPVPKYELPDSSMPADVAYQICHDEMNMDGNPTLNLASFVTTWMEPQAKQLIDESLNKNLIDRDEYPQTQRIEHRCVNMLARLFNAPADSSPTGTSTIGSSEAIMLCGLSHKWRWREKRKAEGKPYDKPNMVIGTNTQVVWHKFGRYFDVEEKAIPMEPGHYGLDPQKVMEAIDENTILVAPILGQTFTGELDPIKEINDLLLEHKKKTGQDIPIHVDAASGGFVIPFTRPELEWDFRLEQVKSINVSGHKFGLVYPGLGWAIWRDGQDLPEDLVFNINYLGGNMGTFTLNFSQSASHVVAQYYNFLRLGKEGYSDIMNNAMKNARYLSDKLKETGKFEMISKDDTIPIVVFRLLDTSIYDVFDLSHVLRTRGWIVPAYTMPPNAESVEVLRVVVRESFTRDLADILLNDMEEAMKLLTETDGKKPVVIGESVNHIC
ncbi:MAG: glutamate decarboxylase [Cyanobacteriota/Melainabacteria group bacterium]